jgi:hypothetical protein
VFVIAKVEEFGDPHLGPICDKATAREGQPDHQRAGRLAPAVPQPLQVLAADSGQVSQAGEFEFIVSDESAEPCEPARPDEKDIFGPVRS